MRPLHIPLHGSHYPQKFQREMVDSREQFVGRLNLAPFSKTGLGPSPSTSLMVRLARSKPKAPHPILADSHGQGTGMPTTMQIKICITSPARFSSTPPPPPPRICTTKKPNARIDPTPSLEGYIFGQTGHPPKWLWFPWKT